MIEPQFVLAFTNFFDIYQSTEPSPRDVIQRKLPASCTVYWVQAEGVIGTDAKTGKTTECERERALSCLLIPRMDSFQVFPTRMLSMTDANDFSRLASGFPNERNVPLFLTFFDETMMGDDILEPIVHTLLGGLNNAVMAGGMTSFVTPPWVKEDEMYEECTSTLGVAMTGGKVRVASCIITEDTRQPKTIREQILLLKKAEIPEKHSFAFMFSCVGRGSHIHNRKNVESGIFREVFPNTPLFGFFGNGEVGHDNIVNTAGKEFHSIARSMLDFSLTTHSYSTVFVLVSYK